MLEEERHTLAIVRSPASLGKLFDGQHTQLQDPHGTYSRTDVNGLNAIAELFLVLVGYRVCDDDLLELAAIQGFDGVATQDAVRDYGKCVFCAFCNQHICSLHKRTAGVSHVVDEDSGLALDISH